jgi:hypothetical protein
MRRKASGARQRRGALRLAKPQPQRVVSHYAATTCAMTPVKLLYVAVLRLLSARGGFWEQLELGMVRAWGCG